MTSSFGALLKVQIRNVVMSMFGRSKKSGKGMWILSLIFPALISMYISGVYAVAFSMELPLELMYFIPVMGFGLGILFSLIFTFYSATGLFKSKDYELLCSLPFSKNQIFIVKLLSLYVYGYIYVFFFMLIPMIVYFWKCGFDFVVLILVFLETLVVPLFTIMVSSLVAMIVTYISSFFKSKSLVQIVLYMLMMIVVLGVSAFVENPESSIMDMNAITQLIKQYAYPVYCFMLSVKDASINYAMQLVGMVVGVFAIYVVIFARFFDRINKALFRTKTKIVKLNDKSYSSNSVSMTLFKRELKRYVQSPIYVMNTCVGPLMLFIGAIVALVQSNELGQIVNLVGGEMTMLVLAISMALLLMLVTTSCCSISLEGKYLWISKSLPVSIMDLFKSKLMLSVVVEYPLALVSLIMYGVALKIDFTSLVLYAFFLLLVSMYASFLGLIVNLHLPKLDYLNEAAVVKQSAATSVFMLGGILSTVVFGVIGFLLMNLDLGYMGIIISICGVLVVLIRFEYWYLATKGQRKFANL